MSDVSKIRIALRNIENAADSIPSDGANDGDWAVGDIMAEVEIIRSLIERYADNGPGAGQDEVEEAFVVLEKATDRTFYEPDLKSYMEAVATLRAAINRTVSLKDLREWVKVMTSVGDYYKHLTTEQFIAAREANESYLMDKLRAIGVTVEEPR